MVDGDVGRNGIRAFAVDGHHEFFLIAVGHGRDEAQREDGHERK